MRASVREARAWAWASLIVGCLVAIGALVSSNVPLFAVQLISTIGALFYLFGSKNSRQCAAPMLTIAGVLEALASVFLLTIGIIFLTNENFSLYGLGVLIGFGSLLLFIPSAGMSAIDFIAASKIRSALREGDTSRRADDTDKSLSSPATFPMLPLID